MPKLTKRLVESTKPDPRRDVWVWDEDVTGLALRVKPSGVRTYLIAYRTQGGRKRKLALGRHGVLTPDQARRQARSELGRVARGEDPAAERRAQRGATVRELSERYMAEHAEPKKRPSSVAKDRANLDRHILPRLGSLPVAHVTREDIGRLHHAIGTRARRKGKRRGRARDGGPGCANRVLALLSKMMNLAEAWGLRPDGSNPCRHVQRFPERKLERFLSPVELARLGETLRELEGVEPAPALAAVRLLLFTGARRSEVLGLRWQDVDLKRGEIRIPEPKEGQPKRIPLNAPARAVLAGLERRGAYVFPTAKGGRPVELSRPWERIREHAGLQDLRLHDLRHGFASVGAQGGQSLYILGKLLGHRQAGTTARYAHLADDPLREASEAIAARIAAAVDGKPAAPVRELPQREGR